MVQGPPGGGQIVQGQLFRTPTTCAVFSVCLILSGATQALRQITRCTPCMLARGGFELETSLLGALARLEETVRVIRNWFL